jgi:hypothetical protein
MLRILRIEGDPTSWILREPIEAERVTASSSPVTLNVAEPLAGRLLLSPGSVRSAVFISQLTDRGHAPNGVILPESSSCLYVPSTTGPDPHSNPPRYYLLPPSADLAALEADITAAMSGGTFVTVDITGPVDPGVVVLNGGTLSFVVLCPAPTGS